MISIQYFLNLFRRTLFIGLVAFFMVGCATTSITESDDNLESFNRKSFMVTDRTDRNILKPIAQAYANITPKPIRTGVTNFFDNLSYLNVIFNNLLQGKLTHAVNDSLRFIFNSTLGIGGIIDVATNDLRLPKNEEDFGQTLATWGVGGGSYIFLPFIGPDTLRNITDNVPSILLDPLFYASASVLLPFAVLERINQRANLLEASNIRDQAAIDPYVFTKEAYLQRRNYLIYDGSPPLSDYETIFFSDDDENNFELKIE